MTAPASLYQPFARLVKVSILGKEFEVPENNSLLRGFQYLAPEAVAMGRFCWNEECQYCRVSFDLGDRSTTRTALACKLLVEDGLQVKDLTPEIRYCLRSLDLK